MDTGGKMNIRPLASITAVILTLLLVAAMALPATAQEGRNQSGRSRQIKEYTFQLTVAAPGDGPGRTLRTIELSCIEREKISFHFGTKAPIPTTTFNPAEGQDSSGQAIPRISYSYQNLGLQFELRVLQKVEDLVFVGLEYNLSFVDPQEGKRQEGDPPVILSHEMERVKGMKAGSPVVVAEFFRPAEGMVLAESLGIDQGAMGNQGPWRLLLTLMPEKK
jgi:hypothetical protein